LPQISGESALSATPIQLAGQLVQWHMGVFLQRSELTIAGVARMGRRRWTEEAQASRVQLRGLGSAAPGSQCRLPEVVFR